jgi:hypothetical protein
MFVNVKAKHFGRCIRIAAATLLFGFSARLEAQCTAERFVVEPLIPAIKEIGEDGKEGTVPAADVKNAEVDAFQLLQRADAPDEVYLWDEGGGSDGLTGIIVRGQEAELRFQADDCPFRYFHRSLSHEELKQFQQFIADKNIEQLPKFVNPGVCDGVAYVYSHLTKKGGRRLQLFNPWDPSYPYYREAFKHLPEKDARRIHPELVSLMKKLADPDRLSAKYGDRRLPADLEVVYAHPNRRVLSVWANGDDVRVRVDEVDKDKKFWQSVRGGKLAGQIEPPPGFLPLYSDRWKVTWGTQSIRMVEDKKKDGEQTWLYEKEKPRQKLFDSPLENPVVTPDGHWLVGTLDKKLIRYNLTEQKTEPLESVPNVDSYSAVFYLPLQKRVLLAKDPSERNKFSFDRFLLLDPTTGKSNLLAWKLVYQADILCKNMPVHAPQATEQKGVFWLTDDFGRICRYDTLFFKVQDYADIFHMQFNYHNFWVDVPAKKLYVIYGGHLLRMSMPQELLHGKKEKSK